MGSWMKTGIRFSFAAAAAFCASAACGPHDPSTRLDATDAAAAVEPPVDAGPPILPNPACAGVVETHVIQGWKHVPLGTPFDYNSNPPSSGWHNPVWASYGTHSNAVDRAYYVHNLEHGAIVLLYKCDAS